MELKEFKQEILVSDCCDKEVTTMEIIIEKVVIVFHKCQGCYMFCTTKEPDRKQL